MSWTLGLSCTIARRDHSTQTNDVMTNNSASSPTALSQPPRRHFYTQTFGLSESAAQEVTSFARSSSTNFRFDSDVEDDNDKETGSDLLLCNRCGAMLTTRDATVGRYCALRELTPQPSDDVIESRDRRARTSHNRTPSPPSLRHQPAAADDAIAEVIIN